MTKTEIREFIKYNKKDIAIVVGSIIIGGACVMLGVHSFNKHKKINEDIKEFSSMLKEAMNGAKHYTIATADEFAELNGGKDIITCSSGGELLKVTGVMFFGNKVET